MERVRTSFGKVILRNKSSLTLPKWFNKKDLDEED